MTVTQAGWLSTTLTWTSMPSPVGTSRLPKSIRSWSGTSWPASHGPASHSGPAPASSGPGSPVSAWRRRNTVTHSLPACFLADLYARWLGVPAHPPGAPRRVPAGGAEAAFRAGRVRQRIHLVQHHMGDLLDDQLRDPVTALETDRVVAVGVEQGDPDLATVPCVHGARRIDDGDTVPGGEP